MIRKFHERIFLARRYVYKCKKKAINLMKLYEKQGVHFGCA